MSLTTVSHDPALQPIAGIELETFAQLPDWLLAIVQPERVRATLARAIPELATGELTAQSCEISRVRLKKDRWTGIYQLTVARPDDSFVVIH